MTIRSSSWRWAKCWRRLSVKARSRSMRWTAAKASACACPVFLRLPGVGPGIPGHPRSVPLVAAAAQARPGLRIVIYTGHAHPCLALAAIEAGAQAYVSKASGARLALDATRTAIGGQRFVDPAIDLDLARNHAWRSLSPNERSILLSLAPGRNLQVLATDSQCSYKTVTAHKYNASGSWSCAPTPRSGRSSCATDWIIYSILGRRRIDAVIALTLLSRSFPIGGSFGYWYAIDSRH